MTNYMYYDYANSKVAKIKEDRIEYENARSMKSYFDKQCLENGSTLEGRKRSFIYLVHKKKYIPITISLSPLRIYFPIAPIKDPSCKWVNFSSIKEILYHKKTCTIIFYDDTCLTCNNSERIKESIHAIYRYLNILNIYPQLPSQPEQP